MSEQAAITRDFTVAVFVICRDHVVMHWHRKLARWLPPGGHIEPNELPDEAALREVWEETGLRIRLLGDRGLPIDYPGQPRQLIRPQGIQLEDISPGHQHIDLVYFAVPEGDPQDLPMLEHGAEWISRDALAEMGLTDEIRDWLHLAFAKSGRPKD
ncbi:MAG: NUDIX domain-containing protein [Thermomicrobiales bacterium]